MGVTPLLDRQLPLPPPVRPGRGSRIIAGVGVMVGVVIALSVSMVRVTLARRGIAMPHPRFLDALTFPRTSGGMILAAALVGLASIAIVVLHECGHVVGGLLAGFRFHTIAIGPLKLDHHFRVSIHRGSLAWSGGWVSMFPATRDRLRWRAIALVAAGPLTCVTVGAGALLAGAVVGPASAVLAVGCLLSALDLLPVRAGAVAFDGWRIVRLLRDDAWSRRWLTLMSVVAAFHDGVAPDELPAADIAAVVALEDDSAETSFAHAVAYASAFYAGDDERSARLLETSLRYARYVPPPFRAGLISDAAVFQARRRNRPDLALAWRDDLPLDSPAWLRTRAEAAVLQARGQVDGAAAKLDECEQAIAAQPMPSEAQRRMVIRQLGRWKAELSHVS